MLDQFCYTVVKYRKLLLRRVDRRMIRMCGVRLVNRVSTDALRDKVGLVVKIKDVIIQSHL